MCVAFRNGLGVVAIRGFNSWGLRSVLLEAPCGLGSDFPVRSSPGCRDDARPPAWVSVRFQNPPAPPGLQRTQSESMYSPRRVPVPSQGAAVLVFLGRAFVRGTPGVDFDEVGVVLPW